MNRVTKTWLIIAIALIVVGIIVISCVMTQNRWSLSALRRTPIEGKTVDIEDDFDSITLTAATEDIVLLPSEDNKCRVIFEDPISRNPVAAVQDGTLVIETFNSKSLKELIDDVQFLAAGTPQIVVYLPDKKYGPISIRESTGDINIEKLSASHININVTTGNVFINSVACDGSIDLALTTGEAKISNITCNSLASKGTTGDIICRNVMAQNNISIERSTGDVTLELCDAEQLAISTGTGDVKGTLLSDKVFVTNTSTGTVNVPDTRKGGNCTVTTSTGDINIDIK